MGDRFAIRESPYFRGVSMLGRLRGVVRQGRVRATAAGAAVAVGLAAFAVGHAATETAALIKVRMGGDSAETRLVIDLDGATSAKILSDGALDRRVVVMLPNVIAGQAQQGSGKGVVRAWMIDQVQGGARLQLDLSGDARLKRRFLLPPPTVSRTTAM